MPLQFTDRIIENLSRGGADAELAEDVVLEDQAQGRVYRGRAAVKNQLRAFYVIGFPNAQTETRCIVANESSAALEYVFHGRQLGMFAGIPPSGCAVSLPIVMVCQFSDGRISRASLYYDGGTLLRQIGLAL